MINVGRVDARALARKLLLGQFEPWIGARRER
jgi:hypothetical protein